MKRKGFYIRLNESEDKMMKTLMDDYSINVSGAFKKFLKRYLEYLKKENVKFQGLNQK
jgi:hypothetical protein